MAYIGMRDPIAAPITSDTLASVSMTRRMICMVEAPMDCAASMTPLSTSFKEDSTMRPIKGAAETTSGTMVAVEP